MPAEIMEGVNAVATEEMITPSAYVRRAVARSLQADGVVIKAERPADQHIS